MGKHSSGRQSPFLTSVFGWIAPWVVISLVIVLAVWIAVRAVGPNEEPTAGSSPSPDPGPTLVEPEPTLPSDEGNEVKEEDEGDDEEDDQERTLITEGIRVQVLNATGGVEGAAERMANRLAELGFEIVAIDTALGNFENTVVYWSRGRDEGAGLALAERFGWAASPKPSNLSDAVDLHVIVGLDEA